MSFNFIAGKPSILARGDVILSGNFTGDFNGDGTDLENVSHCAQTNTGNDGDYRIVFFNNTTIGNERNVRGHEKLLFSPITNVFTVNGGMVHNRRSLTSHSIIQSSDYYIGCNHTASITITLPFASTLTSGQTYTIKDESGAADNYNINIIKQGASNDLIDGQTSVSIQSPYGSINLYSNGSNKFFIY